MKEWFGRPTQPGWTLLHALTLVGAAAILLSYNRNQWFMSDEWNFIVHRSPGLADTDFLRPHNEHWTALPVLSYWALLSTVGLSSYLPYAAVVIAFHLGLAHLLWRAALRCGASRPIATALVAIFAVLGAGAENLVWSFQIAFVGAAACGWAAILLHDHDGPFDRRDVLGWIASIAALMFSGIGLTMVVVATLTVWLRRRRLLDTVLAAAGPAVVFGAWYLVEGRHASTPTGDKWLVVDWAWAGLTHATEAIVGIPGSGALLVLLLLGWWGRHLDLGQGARSIALAGVLGTVAFFLVTGLGRVEYGSPEAGRYAYIAAALLLPGAAFALTRGFPSTPQASAFVVALCALVGVHNLGMLRSTARDQMGPEQEFKAVVGATAQLMRDGTHLNMDVIIDPQKNPDLRAIDVRRLDGYGWLPEIETTRKAELTAETALDVVVTTPRGTPGGVLVSGTATLVPADPSGGADCVIAAASPAGSQVRLESDRATWRVRLSGDAEDTIQMQLVDGEVEGQPRGYTLPAADSDLVSAAKGRTVVVELPPDKSLGFCGVALTDS